jgi:periplasmic divalent cation tolerance protein
MEEFIQVFTTTDQNSIAGKVADLLLKKRLAVCVQTTGPVTSRHLWKGKIETAQEWLLLIKSKKTLFNGLEKTIKEIHNYETPEITAISFFSGSKDYLEWLSSELKKE